MKKATKTTVAERARWRSVLLLVGFAFCAASLEGRILYLQLIDRDFLAEQANDRHLRTVQISAHRGTLTDRYGDWVSYRPPVEPLTWPLWVAPLVMLAAGALLFRKRFRRRG